MAALSELPNDICLTSADRLPPLNPDTIPQTLKKKLKWVGWAYVVREGRTTKIPLDPNDLSWKISPSPAKVTDTRTQAPFADAFKFFDIFANKTYTYHGYPTRVAGIGCVFADSNIIGIDIDHCLTPGDTAPLDRVIPEFSALVQELRDCPSCYIEVSPSGEGLHAFLPGSFPKTGSKRRGQLEMYQEGRFFTVTSQAVKGGDLDQEDRIAASCITTAYNMIQGTGTPGNREKTRKPRKPPLPDIPAMTPEEADIPAMTPEEEKAEMEFQLAQLTIEAEIREEEKQDAEFQLAMTKEDEEYASEMETTETPEILAARNEARELREKTRNLPAPQWAEIYKENDPDSAILFRISHSKPQMKTKQFVKAMSGQLYTDDLSRTDYYVAIVLAQWTDRNADQIERILRNKTLCRLYRKKWDEKRGPRTYLRYTIESACRNCKDSNADWLKRIHMPVPIPALFEKLYGTRHLYPKGYPLYDEYGRTIIYYTAMWYSVTFIDVITVLSSRLYLHGTELVEIRATPASKRETERNSSSHLRIAPVSVADLQHIMTTMTSSMTIKKDRDETYIPSPSKPPKDIMEQVIASCTATENVHKWKYLSGITAVPLFTATRPTSKNPYGYTIVHQNGYDPYTGYYLDVPNDFLPQTLPTVTVARDILIDAIEEFPFVEDVDRAVAFSCILSTVVRPGITTCPMTLITAPAPGTGKSALAELISVIATGQHGVNNVRFSTDEVEFGKRVFAALRSGSPIYVIDNMPNGATLKGHDLDAVLTNTRYCDRVLGESREEEVSTNTIWIANGNQISISEDTTRRVLTCRLARPNEENPENHIFKRTDLTGWALANRGRLVAAILSCLCGYFRTGKPRDNLKDPAPLAGFNEWDTIIRGATSWLLGADPKDAIALAREEDPARNQLCSFINTWREEFGDSTATVTELMDKARETNRLMRALEDCIPHRPGAPLTATTVGRYLQRNKDRLIDGYIIKKGTRAHQAIIWQVVKA